MSRGRPGAIAAAIAGVAVTTAAPASAQSFDILEQDIAVDVSGPDTMVSFAAKIEATAGAAYLDMYTPMMPIVAADVDGVPAVTQNQGSSLVRLTYPTPLAVGQEATVHLVLSGTPSCGYPGAPQSIVCKRDEVETLFTPTLPGSAWYLYNSGDYDAFVGTVTVTAPATHSVVAGQGPATSMEEGPDGAKVWKFDIQHPTENVGLYAGVSDMVTSTDGWSVDAHFHDDGNSGDNAQRAVDIAGQIIPVYSQMYGDFPVSPAHLVTLPKNFFVAGIGLLGLVFLGEHALTSHDYLLEQSVAHELAHTYFGNIASGYKANEAPFLGEAMAEYSAWRALGVVQGDAARTAGVRMSAVWYMYRRPGDEDVPVLDFGVTLSPAYVHVTYHKGSVVLRTLEEAAGVEGFTEALRGFLQGGFGGLAVKDLVEQLAAITGYDATADVEQWLKATGFPRMTVSSQLVEGDAPEVLLAVQSDGAFTYRAPVRLSYSDGTTEEIPITIAPGASEHHLPITQRPVTVEVDPRWTLVREVNPAVYGDVTLDGVVDAADLLDVALRQGGYLPADRRVDGSYDPIYDVDRDRQIGELDLEAVRFAATVAPAM